MALINEAVDQGHRKSVSTTCSDSPLPVITHGIASYTELIYLCSVDMGWCVGKGMFMEGD